MNHQIMSSQSRNVRYSGSDFLSFFASIEETFSGVEVVSRKMPPHVEGLYCRIHVFPVSYLHGRIRGRSIGRCYDEEIQDSNIGPGCSQGFMVSAAACYCFVCRIAFIPVFFLFFRSVGDLQMEGQERQRDLFRLPTVRIEC